MVVGVPAPGSTGLQPGATAGWSDLQRSGGGAKLAEGARPFRGFSGSPSGFTANGGLARAGRSAGRR